MNGPMRQRFRAASCSQLDMATIMSTALSISTWPAQTRTLFPGVLALSVVAAAATFLSEHYSAPVKCRSRCCWGWVMNFLSC